MRTLRSEAAMGSMLRHAAPGVVTSQSLQALHRGRRADFVRSHPQLHGGLQLVQISHERIVSIARDKPGHSYLLD